MTDKPHLNIDFARAAELMDVVQKVASVAPAYTALSGVAMAELKEYNETATKYLDDLGQRRLKEEQDAAAKIAEHNRIETEKQAKVDKVIADRNADGIADQQQQPTRRV